MPSERLHDELQSHRRTKEDARARDGERTPASQRHNRDRKKPSARRHPFRKRPRLGENERPAREPSESRADEHSTSLHVADAYACSSSCFW